MTYGAYLGISLLITIIGILIRLAIVSWATDKVVNSMKELEPKLSQEEITKQLDTNKDEIFSNFEELLRELLEKKEITEDSYNRVKQRIWNGDVYYHPPLYLNNGDKILIGHEEDFYVNSVMADCGFSYNKTKKIITEFFKIQGSK